MNPRLKEIYYSKIQVDLAKKLSLRNKLMSPRLKKVVFIPIVISSYEDKK